ncbi:MAG: ABC transporter permease, partial [Candidatus Izemoplasmataceae bacterium]
FALLSRFNYKPVLSKFKLMLITYRRGLVSLVMFTIVSSLFLLSLFTRNMITDFKDTTLEGNDYTHRVVLSRFTNTIRPESEPFTTTTTKMVAINNQLLDETFTVSAYGISQEVTLKKLVDNDLAKNVLLLDGFVITQHAAMKYDLNIGDTVSLRFGSLVYTQEIVGINNDLIESAIYINQADLNARLGFPAEYFNGYYTMNETISDPQAIRIVNYEDVAKELETLFTLSNQVTFLLMSLALVVSLLMFYFLTLNRLLNEVPTYLTLKALGYYDKELYVRYFYKTWVGLLIAFILSYFIVSAALLFMRNYLYTALGFAFNLSVYFPVTVLSFIVVSTLILAVTMMVYKRLSSIDLSTVLKA